MDARRGRQGAVALGVAAVLALFVAGRPASDPDRAVGTTAEVRTVAVADVVLGVGADESEVRVTWSSDDPRARCVEYGVTGTDPAGARVTAGPTAVAASASGPSAGEPGRTWFHAALPGLQPSAEYSYRIGDCAAAWSPSFRFATHQDDGFSFIFLGDPQLLADDPGSAAGWATTLEVATARFPETDLLVTAGDHVDSADPVERATEWDMALAPAALRTYPVAPALGNHDDADGSDTRFGEHFTTPHSGSAGETVPGSGDYWFTHDDTLVVVLNSNDPDSAGHAAYLDRAIAAASSSRWTIVVFHHSPFSASVHADDRDVSRLRETLVPVLGDLGVDLVLGGHDHSYSRSFLMDGEAPVPGSGGDAVTARGGQVLYLAANSASGTRFRDLAADQPWIAVAEQDDVPSYTHVVVGDESITITTHRTPDGSVVDRVVLRQAAG